MWRVDEQEQAQRQALAKVPAREFHPWLYWRTIIATTTVGTTLADFADRSLGIGYFGGASLLLALVLLSLLAWQRVMGSVAVESVNNPEAEAFYWATIMFSQTLGTALGDWAADSMGVGDVGAGYFWTSISRTSLFWAAFVLTRPLGASLGDFLDKPATLGGLAFSRYEASGILLACIVIGLLMLPQRAARVGH